MTKSQMKLGIAMLIIGLGLAAFGVYLVETGGMLAATEPEEAIDIPIGWALLTFGGGLSIGGIVRMIIKR